MTNAAAPSLAPERRKLVPVATSRPCERYTLPPSPEATQPSKEPPTIVCVPLEPEKTHAPCTEVTEATEGLRSVRLDSSLRLKSPPSARAETLRKTQSMNVGVAAVEMYLCGRWGRGVSGVWSRVCTRAGTGGVVTTWKPARNRASRVGRCAASSTDFT